MKDSENRARESRKSGGAIVGTLNPLIGDLFSGKRELSISLSLSDWFPYRQLIVILKKLN